MQQLKQNYTLRLENGRSAEIVSFLGEGAQGAVYKVNNDGELKALKWFRRNPDKRFLDNIRKNISEGAPSPIFLWPEALTKMQQGGIGYIMPLKPDGFFEFSKFRLAKVRFKSFRAIIEAAMNLCEAFRLLHASGLSYQDLNDGGFFINPDNGGVRICDCDNVFPHGENSDILGKARFMAPEVVMGKNLPNCYTDRFSLTVILFMLFCIDHPFEGHNVVRHPCLTEAIEQVLFGKELCFIYDKDKTQNRPVRGVHHNVMTMWAILPKPLKDALTSQFSSETLGSPQDRMTEMQWSDLLLSLRDHLMKCPRCGDETFVYDREKCLNPRCGSELIIPYRLEGSGRSIPLINGSTIRFEKSGQLSGVVVEKPNEPGVLLIKNLSPKPWNVLTPSGKSLVVASNGFMPVKPNLTISSTVKLTIHN